MASQKGVTQTRRHSGGDAGQGYSYYDDMTPAELKEREVLITQYEAMQARQEAYMERRQADFAAHKRLMPSAGVVYSPSPANCPTP